MTQTLILFMLLRGITMTPLELMYHRNVQVTTEEGMCSGVILSTGVVLTAFHALEVDSKVFVNGKEAELFLVRPDIDLLVLHVETEDLPDITFGLNVGVAAPVIAVGNPNGMVGTISYGHIVHKKEGHLYTDTLAMHGFSGGGVYTTDGVLVGLMQGIAGREGRGSWVVISLNAEEITKALK